jgi:hypothetical protein
MSEIILVRNQAAPVTEADKDAARRVLFGAIDGLGDKGRKQWRRFVTSLFKLEPGEMVSIHTRKKRLGWYHRKHMALETRLFEAQERFEHFEQFRNWLKVGSGFCDWVVGPKGGVIPVPKSISYEALEQGDMEAVHADMVAFMRTPHAQKALWPKSPVAARSDAVELLFAEFNE